MQDLLILIRPKKRFTSLLIFAFFSALGIHLTAFFLFRIQLFSLYEEAKIFPSTFVETDQIDSSHVVSQKMIPTLPSYVPTIEFSTPQFPEMTSKSFLSDKEVKALFTLTPISMNLNITPMQFYPIGHLFDQIELVDVLETVTKEVTHLHKDRAIYEVAVNQREGKIFWWKTVKQFQNESLSQNVEKTLEKLSWKVHSEEPFLQGKIEVVVIYD